MSFPGDLFGSRLDADTVIKKVVQRRLPEDPSQVVPLLDRFSRTRAAPKRNGLHMESVSDSIGSYASPQASVLKFDPHSKQVVWKMEAFDERNSRGPPDPPRLKGKFDYVTNQKQIMPDSDLHSEIAEAQISINDFYETWVKFNLYCETQVPLTEIPEIKEEWLHNVDFLIQADNYDIPSHTMDFLLESMVKEVRSDYIRAAQRAVVEYVLSDPRQRSRCGILFVPDIQPLWGTTPFVAPEGTFGGAPLEWRPALDNQRRMLLQRLTCFNPAALAAQALWADKFKGLRLFASPNLSHPPFMIENFLSLQQEIRDSTREELDVNWSRGIREILVKHPFLEGKADLEMETLFFKSFATLLAGHVRSCVENSISDFAAFMENFATPNPSDAFTICSQDDSVPITNSFLVVKAIIKGSEFRFRTVLDTLILAPILKTFTSIVSALRDLARPDVEPPRSVNNAVAASNSTGADNSPNINNVNQTSQASTNKSNTNSASDSQSAFAPSSTTRRQQAIAAAAAAEGSPHLRFINDNDILVTSSRQRIEDIVQMNLANANRALLLFEPFTWILVEQERLTNILEKQSTQVTYTKELLSADLRKLRDAEEELRSSIPHEVRLQMITVNLTEVTEGLSARIKACEQLLFAEMSERLRNECNKIDKAFDHRYSQLRRRPIATEPDLVEIEAIFDQFKATESKELFDRYKDQLSWLNLLFSLNNQLTPDDFSAMQKVSVWVKSCDEKLKEIEFELHGEHARIENNFKNECDAFLADVKDVLDQVIVLRTIGNNRGSRGKTTTLDMCNNLKQRIDDMFLEKDKINKKELLLGVVSEPTSFEGLTEAHDVLEPFLELWQLDADFNHLNSLWYGTKILGANVDEISTKCNMMWKSSHKLELLFQNYPDPRQVAKSYKEKLHAIKPHIEVLEALAEPGMQQRHWDRLAQVAMRALEAENLTLRQAINYGFDQHIETLKEISETAARESGVESAHRKMCDDWEALQFEFAQNRDVSIISGNTADEIQQLLDDHIVRTQSIRGSPFAKHVEGKILEWDTWLNDTQKTMDYWIKVQKQWIYLEPIFASDDIMKQMPAEGKMFKEVNSDFRAIMAEATSLKRVNAIFKMASLQARLIKADGSLETVQVGLNQYLETKRRSFPRFFFLSNEELLSILSETREPRRVQDNIKKCFDGIAQLEFQPDNKITGMISEENELVRFTNVVDPMAAKGNVEQWLGEVEEAMLESTRFVIIEALKDYSITPRVQWVQSWAGQAVLAVDQIMWTNFNGQAIRTGGVEGLVKYCQKQTEELNAVVALVRSEIPKLVRCTLEALIVLDVHGKDVTEELSVKGVTSENDFNWLVQLRYYMQNNTDLKVPAGPNGEVRTRLDLFVEISNSRLPYMYEYLGNSPRLVITPLTDRCYRTLCGALHLQYGGAPEGPAGTGKTETVKDLGKALARMVQVFNCSDGLDVESMAKFFSGLASTGGWACFDEFNRINVEVLSVIAQQITTIQEAIAAEKTEFMFEGAHLRLVHTCNCFITMNPGYAGRAELPDNLKALFRSVAMMVPDYRLISEISLYSFGFDDARNMARKIVTTYKLCSEQLSAQKHYDYGMRAVKAVLTAAGNLKRKFPTGDESILILRAINDVNLAKFLEPDVPLFKGITSDLFPGTVLPTPDYVALLDAIKHHMALDGIQPAPYALEKIIQLYEMILVRHGLMVVGDPWGGKSTSLKILSKALTDLAAKGLMDEPGEVKIASLNPKSVAKEHLYGDTDEATGTYTDGVLAALYKQFAYDRSKTRKWLVMDGPVDAVWIEDMNTVLDDNKKLCLKSGEVVAMPAFMNMIFEPMDLSVASPATVSRCGMVYFEPDILGINVLLDSWMDKKCPSQLSAELRSEIMGMCKWIFPPLLDHSSKFFKYVSPCQKPSCFASFLRILSAMLGDALAKNPKMIEELGEKPSIIYIDAMVVFSVIWSVGSVIDTDSRKDFDQYFRKLINGGFPDIKNFKRLSPNFPDRHSTFDWFFNNETQTWVSWTDITDGPQTFAPNLTSSELIVRTVDMIRFSFFNSLAIRHEYPILFCGATGTGKTVYMESVLNELDLSKFMTIPVCFSAQTSESQTQALIDGRLDRAGRKDMFGASMNRRTVIFVDDLNMPAVEAWGAQPPIELLRQFMDYGGWYDLSTKDHPFKNIVRTMITSAMGLPGGGRSFVTPRILRHFHLVGFPLVENDNLTQIFTTILNHVFNNQGYPAEVSAMSPKIVASTMDVYRSSLAELRPTPVKSHYTFNLRDFANVIKGFLMVDKDGHDGTERVVRLWTHEVWRVFGDRLIDDKDRLWLFNVIRETCKKHYSLSFDACASHLDSNGDGKVDSLDELRFLIFGDLLSQPGLPKRPYIEIKDFHALQTAVEGYLEQYNQNNHTKQMSLVMFAFAIEHLSRVCRVLKVDGGNVLLVGVGGSGRQSISKMASFMADCYTHQIEISTAFSMQDWRDNIKLIVRRAGGKGEGVVFLFSDSQIKYESFVEDINNMLNSGEVPNLWPSDEKAEICETVRSAAKQEGKATDGTPQQLYAFLVQRTRKKLHIVLCLSPIGEAFRSYIRQFPSLVNCCTIDWFGAWPSDALVAVAHRALSNVDLSDKIKNACVDMCQYMHAQTSELADDFWTELKRKYYTTPTSFLELINTFKTLLGQQREKISSLKTRYEQGLMKLDETKDSVAGMQETLTALKPQLVEQSEKVKIKLVEVGEQAEKASETRTSVEAEKAVASAEAAEAERISKICEADLAEVMPIMQSADKALDVLEPKDFTELKAYSRPPEKLLPCCEALMILLGVKPTIGKNPESGKMEPQIWKSALGVLSDRNLINTLKSYDKYSIDVEKTDRVRKKFIDVPEKPLDHQMLTGVSRAIASVAQWCAAICAFERAYKTVKPKQEELAKANASLEKTRASLKLKEDALAQVQAQLDRLNQELEDAQNQQKKLKDDYDLCELKLQRAHTLIDSLGSENIRWTAMFKKYSDAFITLTGDMLLSAGVIAYLGAFTPKFRATAVQRWSARCHALRIPGEAEFSLTDALGDPVLIQNWFAKFLPKDASSVENAIIIEYARRWPLCIDPQGQATNWIKKTYAAPAHASRLTVCKPSDAQMSKKLEAAISLGNIYLLESVGETVNPSLEPLLLKQTFKRGGSLMIKLGENTIEYSNNFRFFMTSKLRNPHYLPEVAVKVTLINFMITLDGLQDQLLGTVVRLERADLEEMKRQLINESADNKRDLQSLESQILEVLNKSSSILDDDAGIKVLSDSKAKATEIEIKQEEGEETEKKIDEARQQYVPVAARSATLFFAIADLASIDPMYQYSLPFYQQLFENSIKRTPESNDIQQRLLSLNEVFLLTLFQNICRSLFEKHKLLFSFLLYVRIKLSESEINEKELKFLLTGGVSIGEVGPKPALWIPDRAWNDLVELDKLAPSFNGISSNMETHINIWKAIYEADDPLDVTFPPPCNQLSEFQLLLVLRCIRPDRLMSAVHETVTSALGPQLTTPPPFDLEASFNDSLNVTPLIFILSPGSDPFSAVRQFGEMMGQKIHAISLGQGQGRRAEELMSQAQQSGEWTVLQNCHLAESWMPKLEQRCEAMEPTKVHRDFRLWLTSYPSAKFPVGVLQAGVKMTNEPPKGLRANIANSYLTDPLSKEDFFNDPFEEPPMGSANAAIGVSSGMAFKKLVFALSFFHAVIQERRLYGPLGWNIPYEFNDSDLRISAKQLRLFLTDYPSEIPFPALLYLTGECNYGGRVTDDKDRRLLITILNSFYTQEALSTDFDFGIQKLVGDGGDSNSPFFCPPDSNLQKDFYDHIMSTFPNETPPEVLGFHPNARLTKAQNEAFSLLSDLLLTSADLQVAKLAPIGDDERINREVDEGSSEEEDSQGKENIQEINSEEAELRHQEELAKAEIAEAARIAKIKAEKAAAAAASDAAIFKLCEDILHQLPPIFIIEEVQLIFPIRPEESMNTVLVQELQRFNNLINVIVGSLKNIQKAIQGLVLLSNDLERCMKSLLDNRIPAMWEKYSYPSLKPLGSYIKDLLVRLQFFQNWIDAGRPPRIFWVSGFFFTQSFLTGVLQNFARADRLEIDKCDLDFEFPSSDPPRFWDDEESISHARREAEKRGIVSPRPDSAGLVAGRPTSPPSAVDHLLGIELQRANPRDGAYIEGLFVEGARFDAEVGYLAESRPRELFSAMSVIQLKPRLTSDISSVGRYQCPVYKVTSRRGVLSTTGHSTNFVMNIRVPSTMPESHWIKRGVAMVTQLDD